MKKAFYVLFPFVVLLSCRPKEQQPAGNKVSPAAIVAWQRIEKLKAIYHGFWIKDDYFRKVNETKSVLAAVGLVKGITGMKIDTALLTGDSLAVSVGWDNHNPGNVTLKFKSGKNSQSLQFGEDELGYAIQNQDTTLVLYQVYQGALYKTLYHKAKVNAEENVNYAINVAINKALIAGQYTLTNAKGTTRVVSFEEDGKVTGLAKFSKYLIENDLEFKPLNNLDLITFDVFTGSQQAYSYVFKNNILEFYDVKPDAKGSLMVLGKIKYKLIKANQ